MVGLSQALMLRSFSIAMLLSLVLLSASAQSTINLRIMPLGDSITAGYLSTTADGYRGPLANALSSQIGTLDFVGSQIDGTMADPDNEGHFGYRIDQIASLATGELNTYKPNLVTLDIGINELGQNYEVSTAPGRLASLIDQVLSAEPDATVLVAQLIVNATASTEAEVVTFNSQLPAIVQARASAGKHIYLVDMSALTTADLSDGLHPNDTGYQLMANAWDSAIQQAISNGWINDPVSGSATRPTGAIYSGITGKCLDNYDVSSTAGSKVDIYDCNGSAAQQWNLNNGSITINGLCLDIKGGGTSNGTLVDLWGCTGGSNQQWTIENGTLINPASGRCLDDPGSNTTNGTQLDIWDCNSGTNQQWRVPSEGFLASGVAGMCLDVFGGSAANGTKVDIYGCNNTAAQQWEVTNNTLTFDGKCLDIPVGATANGTAVEVSTCTGGSNQVWTSTYGALVNQASGKCLDDPGATQNDGTQLDIWDCNSTANQQWELPQQ
jgi:lysophospholipase L1-like esterase